MARKSTGRTQTIGFRTTEDVKEKLDELVGMLSGTMGLCLSRTQALEHLILQAHRKFTDETDGQETSDA